MFSNRVRTYLSTNAPGVHLCDKEIMAICALGKFSTNANKFFVLITLAASSWQGTSLADNLYERMQLRVRKKVRRTIFIAVSRAENARVRQ